MVADSVQLGHLDLGQRCDRHVGEVFMPRCGACDRANDREQDRRIVEGRVKYSGKCDRHEYYPLPCIACARARLEVSA